MWAVLLRFLSIVVSVCAALAAEPSLDPVTVCEVIQNPQRYDGTAIAVLGKFSFRETAGRFIGEAACSRKLMAGAVEWPSTFRVIFDTKNAPKPPDVIQVHAGLLNRKLAALKQHTPLGKFRFASVDYDRWAVVYGRVEFRHDLATASITPAAGKKAGLEPSPAQVVCSGEAAVVFIPEEQ